MAAKKDADPDPAVQQLPAEPIEQNPSVDDPLRVKPDMTPEQVEGASPGHLLLPDPLPALNRPIYDPPAPVNLGVMHLHPGEMHPAVAGAVEELRTRLSELREFLKRFSHDVGGDLGGLVDHLRAALGVPKPNPELEVARRREDEAIASHRQQEDAVAPPTASRRARREEEDLGLAARRRMMDAA